jgi:hypothetical protein
MPILSFPSGVPASVVDAAYVVTAANATDDLIAAPADDDDVDSVVVDGDNVADGIA